MENKITDFLFGKKALDKAAGKTTTAPAPSTDTSYIQNIVNSRMKEKMAPKANPLVNEIKKAAPKKSPANCDPYCKK